MSCHRFCTRAEMLTWIRELSNEHSRTVEDYKRQLEHALKSGAANTERARRRAEAEVADLRGTISSLEVDISKVYAGRINSKSQSLMESGREKPCT